MAAEVGEPDGRRHQRRAGKRRRRAGVVRRAAAEDLDGDDRDDCRERGGGYEDATADGYDDWEASSGTSWTIIRGAKFAG
jgi:hypothetical protein